LKLKQKTDFTRLHVDILVFPMKIFNDFLYFSAQPPWQEGCKEILRGG